MGNSPNYHRRHLSHSASTIMATGVQSMVLFLSACLLLGTTGTGGTLLENTNGHATAFAFPADLPSARHHRSLQLQSRKTSSSSSSSSSIASKRNIDMLGFDENDDRAEKEQNNPGGAIDPNRRRFFSENFVGALAAVASSTATATVAVTSSHPSAASAAATTTTTTSNEQQQQPKKKSRTEGYAVQHTEREWAYILSGAQYNILRRGGTERQRSSILNTFTATDHVGTYVCAGCRTPLFGSESKFDSRTGWPSFASALVGGVELEELDPIHAALDGREVRCMTCGGHLGDLFNDGWIYRGTQASATGKRYCIDGAALIFEPTSTSADGVVPDNNNNNIEEADLIYGDMPPPNKVIQYEPFTYRGA